MEGAGFLDIETPILFKPTPEGARDFLVPSRLQQGRFFALPQSPQILKQLLVIGGFERYYQIARCFRDEDLRADRSHELTQLDVEMAFPDVEFILELMEQMVREIWQETLGVELETPFPRMTYAEAMLRYGTDKPDLRFELEIQDATEVTRGSEFKVFADAPAVRYLVVPQEYSRADLEKLEAFAKEWGAKGLAYIVYGEEGEPRSPIAKFLSEQELAAFRAEPGSTVLFGADEPDKVARVLGALRSRLGGELGLIDEDAFRWTWVTDFPMFQWSEEDDTLDRGSPSVHAAGPRVGADARQGSGQGARRHVRPGRQRRRARRRLGPDPRGRAPGKGLRHPADLARGAAGALRVPARGPRDGRAAARRNRVRHRPHGHGPGAASRTCATPSRSRRTRRGSTR